jgi:glycosyltransferase involved in cell wall biosynthesis
MARVSVIIGIYNCAPTLVEALDSLYAQTFQDFKIILCEDGSSDNTYQVAADYASKHDNIILIRNEKNMGLAMSLNNGLKVAKGDIIVRMDSDDIAYPERISKQVDFMEQRPDIDVVGSWVSEFIDTPENEISTRKVPELSEGIYEFGKSRNPMNHPSVAFRRDRVMEHGGYTHFWLFEDYCLWAQLLVKGYRFYNFQESLLWFRISADMFARRGGWKYAITEQKFQFYLHGIGYISFAMMLKNCIIRFSGRIIPNSIRRFMYYRFMRR